METHNYKVILVKQDNPQEEKIVHEVAKSAIFAAYAAELDNAGYICTEAMLVE